MSVLEALKQGHTHTSIDNGRWINIQKAASGTLRPLNKTMDYIPTSQQLSVASSNSLTWQ